MPPFMKTFRFISIVVVLWFLLFISMVNTSEAARISATSTTTPTPTVTPTPSEPPRSAITKETVEVVEPLKRELQNQEVNGDKLTNFIKYAIRNSVEAGVPPNTIVLLLLLPGVATLIAAARHLIGLRGFGIFLPAALSIVFLAIGPLIGIAVFVVITFVSTIVRLVLRKFKIKLQYLPRMALLLFFMAASVVSILFLAPVFNSHLLSNISIFPVLFLILFVEDFIRVQLGKSLKTAFSLTVETMILSLVSYALLTMWPVQKFVLLNPEIWLIVIFTADILIGRYSGLRLLEVYRFRKLLKN